MKQMFSNVSPGEQTISCMAAGSFYRKRKSRRWRKKYEGREKDKKSMSVETDGDGVCCSSVM